MKTLNGSNENNYFNSYSLFFKQFLRVKPGASRARSSEVFYLGKGFKLGDEYMRLRPIIEKVKRNEKLEDKDLLILGNAQNPAALRYIIESTLITDKTTTSKYENIFFFFLLCLNQKVLTQHQIDQLQADKRLGINWEIKNETTYKP